MWMSSEAYNMRTESAQTGPHYASEKAWASDVHRERLRKRDMRGKQIPHLQPY